jgi:hypothetical protein
VSRSAVSRRIGIGAVAAPSRCRRPAQNGWSARTGTGTAGTPARSPAAVVPAPAWCTTAAVRGNSHSCGASPIVSTSGDDTCRPAHPDCTTARTFARRTASSTGPLSRSPCPGPMLPKPMNTGGGPASRNAASSAGGAQPAGTAGHQYPTTSSCGRQSAGRGTTAGLNPWNAGHRPASCHVRRVRIGSCGRPRRARRRRTGPAYRLWLVHAAAAAAPRLIRRPSERPPSSTEPKSPVGATGCRKTPAHGTPAASATW